MCPPCGLQRNGVMMCRFCWWNRASATNISPHPAKSSKSAGSLPESARPCTCISPRTPISDTWEGARSMIGKIRRVAELTGPLDPHSFVLHVDFPSLHGTGGEPSAEQQEWTAEALREIAACLPAPERLAVENLETYAPSFWDRWLAGTPYSRCLDVGHIWKDGGDPRPCACGVAPSGARHPSARSGATREARQDCGKAARPAKRLRKNWRKGTCPACSGLVRVTTSHSGSCRRNSWMM